MIYLNVFKDLQRQLYDFLEHLVTRSKFPGARALPNIR